jgi:hypothetical protein
MHKLFGGLVQLYGESRAQAERRLGAVAVTLLALGLVGCEPSDGADREGQRSEPAEVATEERVPPQLWTRIETRSLEVVPPQNAELRALRLGDGPYLTPDEAEHASEDDLTAAGTQRLANYGALLEYAGGQLIEVGFSVHSGLPTLVWLNHPLRAPEGAQSSIHVESLRIELAAESRLLAEPLEINLDGRESGEGLAGAALSPGTHVLRVHHPEPTRLQQAAFRAYVDSDGHIYFEDEIDVQVQTSSGASLLIVSEVGDGITFGDVETPLDAMLTLVTTSKEIEVATNDGRRVWSGSFDGDALLSIGAVPRRQRDQEVSAPTPRQARLAAERACDTYVHGIGERFGLDVARFPRNLIGIRTGIELDFDESELRLTRSSPVEFEEVAEPSRYVCEYDVERDVVESLRVHGGAATLLAGSIRPSVVGGADLTDLAAFVQPGAVPTYHAQDTESADPIPLSMAVVAGGQDFTGSTSIVPLGDWGTRTRVDAMTVWLPVTEMVAVEYVAEDPMSRIEIVMDEEVVLSGTGRLAARVPAGSSVTAVAVAPEESRYLDSEPQRTVHDGDASYVLEQDRQVLVTLRSSTPGTRLIIDGVGEVEEIPAEVLLVADEEYVIHAIAPDDSWFDVTRRIRFTGDEVVDVDPAPAASVTFTSDPPGATITVDGELLGPTPVTVKLPVGATIHYHIAGRAPIYRGFSGRVDVTGDLEHPTYLARWTEAERQAHEQVAPAAPEQPPAAMRPSLPAGSDTAREFADGLRRSITGRAVSCAPELRAVGATCFTATYTQSTAKRLVDSILGQLPGVRWERGWMTDGPSEGRAFSYRGRTYVIVVAELDIVEVLIVVAPA